MFASVVFDLDGTLLNTIDDLADSSNWVCSRMGWPTHTVQEYRYFVGNGIPKLVERFTPEACRTPETLARALALFDERYAAHKADKTAPYPGIAQLLQHLQAAGVRYGVSATAKAAGLASCGVLWGFRTLGELQQAGADHIAETPAALQALILGQ